MNIFYTGSIRGGRARHVAITQMLEKYGVVSSPLAYFDTLSGYGEAELPRHDIWKREQEALGKSDVVVAEVSTPSLGVGYLIACAASLGKKVIALYQGGDSFKLSAMIQGDPHVAVYTYKNDNDIARILVEALGEQH